MFRGFKDVQLSIEEIANILNTVPGSIEEFERVYKETAIDKHDMLNLFEINSRNASNKVRAESSKTCDRKVIDRIVKELYQISEALNLPDNQAIRYLSDHRLNDTEIINKEELEEIDEDVRPQITGRLMPFDINELAYKTLLFIYRKYKEEVDVELKKTLWHIFMQGLDILDLDPILYAMLSKNKNSMGYWFPKLADAVNGNAFFKVPETKIVKVPISILQLTRMDYFSLNRTTLDIVDEWAMRAFKLDVNKSYFIKTGTYSSKFDFRNAKVVGENEVKQLGEYLLYIHFQANQMASPLATPTIVGVSTTNEWIVREFIEDKEKNPSIYKGLPLHTEYRAFVDFDTDKVLYIHPYWDHDVMLNRLGVKHEDALNKVGAIHDIHDWLVFDSHYKTLKKRYDRNKDRVVEELEKLVPQIDIDGQWSIDIMQNGEDFWIIDMALAEQSAFVDKIPGNLIKHIENDWLPSMLEVKKICYVMGS